MENKGEISVLNSVYFTNTPDLILVAYTNIFQY